MPPGKSMLWSKLRSTVGVRFTRFAGVALASLATSELTLALCDGVFHLTATPAAVASWFTGAVVSYLLSRWAWERKGKPDVLRETMPFWVISALVVVILTLSTKFGYYAARWLHLHGWKHVAFVGLVYLVANFITFLTRFVIFHYVLFKEPQAEASMASPDHESAAPRERAHRLAGRDALAQRVRLFAWRAGRGGPPSSFRVHVSLWLRGQPQRHADPSSRGKGVGAFAPYTPSSARARATRSSRPRG